MNQGILYRYDKSKKVIEEIMCVEEKGIYSITGDDSNIYLGTMGENATVYIIDSKTYKIKNKVSGFSKNGYVYNLVTDENFLYICTATNAELWRYGLKTGVIENIEIEELDGESGIYGVKKIGRKLIMILSPSSKIISMDLDTDDVSVMCDCANDLPIADERVDDQAYWNTSGMAILFSKDYSSVVGQLENYDSYLFMLQDDGWNGVTRDGDYHWGGDSSGTIDLLEYLKNVKVSAPQEVCIYDGVVTFPDRIFTTFFTTDGKKMISKIYNEPQASIATEDGIWTCNYTDASIWHYNWDVLYEEDKLDDEKYKKAEILNQCRPFQMDISSDQKFVAIGTGPLYGEYGGALSLYYLEYGTLLTFYDIIEKQSITAVVCDRNDADYIYCGTGAGGETTSILIDEKPCIFKFDEESREVIWSVDVSELNSRIVDIVILQGNSNDDNNYVVALDNHGHLYQISTSDGSIVNQNTSHRIVSIITESNYLYAIDYKHIYLSEGDLNLRELYDNEESHFTGIYKDGLGEEIYIIDDGNLVQFFPEKVAE